MDRFNPLPIPRFEEGLLPYLDQSFQALSRILNGEGGVPVGTLQYTISTTAPTGWLLMDGSSYNRNQYPELAAVVPAAWIVSNTLTLPNWAGRVLIGAGTGPSLSVRTLGSTGGAETHTLTINEMPSHNHNVAWGGSPAGGQNKVVEYPAGYNNALQNDPTYINYAGGGQAHNNMQPWAAANIMIKY